MTAQAGFSVGQVVHHLKFDYRGVILDVDADFQGTDEWYDQIARSRPPKDKPWYQVLVDGGSLTYVAERHLEVDKSCKPVWHPAIEIFFDDFRDCSYQVRRKTS